jgi:hypothetical protein
MVNARVLSEEDLALHLQTRALQSTRKAAVKRVVANLKKYPQFASVVDHHFAGVLKSEGLQPVIVVSRKNKKAPPSGGKSGSAANGKKAKTTTDGDESGCDEDDGEDENDGDDDEDDVDGDLGKGIGEFNISAELRSMIVTNPYRKLVDWSVQALQEILNMLNPVSMSEVLTIHVSRRGKRRESQEVFCNLIEYCTGLPMTYAPRKAFNTVDQFMEFVLIEFRKRGCRGDKLKIVPLDFDNDGIFEKTIAGSTVIVRHRFTNAEVEVPALYTRSWDLASLRVENNHSETSAVLTSSSPKAMRFNINFPNHFVGTYALPQVDRIEATIAQGGEMIEDQPHNALPGKRIRGKVTQVAGTAQVSVVKKPDIEKVDEDATKDPQLAKFFTGASFKLKLGDSLTKSASASSSSGNKIAQKFSLATCVSDRNVAPPPRRRSVAVIQH